MFGCGLLLLLTVLLALAYRQAERQAESDIRNLSLVLEARLDSGLLKPLQTSLRQIAQLVGKDLSLDAGDRETLIGHLREHRVSSLSGVEFEFIDSMGKLVFSSKKFQTQPSFEQLSYWTMLGNQRVYGSPGREAKMLIDKDEASRLLRVAMPVFDARQNTVGWVTAVLPLSTITDLFDKVDVGPDGVITIRRIDRPEIVLRDPPLDKSSARFTADSLSEQLAFGAREGDLHMRSNIDGVERLYGFTRMGDYPLALSIGLACRDYLREWFFMLGLSSGLCALLFLIILGLDKRLLRVQAREAEAEDELKRADEHTRRLLDTVGHAILGIDLEGRCTFGNAACRRLLKVAEDQPLYDVLVEEYLRTPEGNPASGMLERVLRAVTDGEELHCEEDLRISGQDEVFSMDISAYPRTSDGHLFGAVVTLQDISERKRAMECISSMAYHDALTGLPNRRHIQEHIERTIDHCTSNGGGFSLLYLDVDNFKNINDSLGHVTGDAILCMLADRLGRVAGVDTVARLGGDEFLILTPVSTEPQLEELLVGLGAGVREPWTVEGRLLDVEVSIGVALHPEHGGSFDELFKAADIALNQAKKNGRNRHLLYAEEMGSAAIKRLQLQMELRSALQNGELAIHYQPQIEVATGRVIGAEALLRWNHPQRGMIPPSVFIPEAEATGLILPIGSWLLRTVCQQSVLWQRMGFTPHVIAVNCSVIQFKQGDLVNDVAQALAVSGLEPVLLELELTESVLIEDTERMIATILELKAMGVKLTIDDFGTGYSSMAYLKHLAVDKLKIDQSFIKNLADNPDDRIIVQAMVTLAHNLKLQVVAEGVENEEALKILIAQGCDEVQGYLFSRPLAVSDFEEFVASFRPNVIRDLC